MGTVIDLRNDDRPLVEREPTGHPPATSSWLLLGIAVLAPVATALLLTPWRDRLAAADDALVLVVVIVAVATAGHRWAAAVCALSSALAFDFLLTRPYDSLRITRSSDLVTELLLLVVGLAVGDLAARGRVHRTAAGAGRRHLALLHAVNEQVASGVDPGTLADQAAGELQRLLGLRSCTYSSDDVGTAARVQPDGQVCIGAVAWSTGDLGLPHRGVDLPVRARGTVVGHFLLVPVPGFPVGRDDLLVAVAIADQVGAAFAAAPRTPRGSATPPLPTTR